MQLVVATTGIINIFSLTWNNEIMERKEYLIRNQRTIDPDGRAGFLNKVF